jgi:hypothetical protein
LRTSFFLSPRLYDDLLWAADEIDSQLSVALDD